MLELEKENIDLLKARGYTDIEILDINSEYIEGKNNGIIIPIKELYLGKTVVGREYKINSNGQIVDEEIIGIDFR